MAKQRSAVSGERTRSARVDSQIGRAFIGLRETLLHGELGRGERISELPLVSRLGTSRTPIRLALERLAHIGMLDVLPGGGFTVRGFTLAEALDAIELRGVLEGTAARFAAERLRDESELDGLRHACTQMEALDGLTIDTFAIHMDLNESFSRRLHRTGEERDAAPRTRAGQLPALCVGQRDGLPDIRAAECRRESGDRKRPATDPSWRPSRGVKGHVRRASPANTRTRRAGYLVLRCRTPML